jgi:hypothetical protein
MSKVKQEDVGPAQLIAVVKAVRKDKELLENRQVTIRDVTAKIKKRKWLFVKSFNRRSLI